MKYMNSANSTTLMFKGNASGIIHLLSSTYLLEGSWSEKHPKHKIAKQELYINPSSNTSSMQNTMLRVGSTMTRSAYLRLNSHLDYISLNASRSPSVQ